MPVDVAHIVRNNIYLYGIRGEGKSATHRAEAFMTQKRFDATKIHTHTFPLEDLPTAIRYAKDRVEDAIKVVVKAKASPRKGGGGVDKRRREAEVGGVSAEYRSSTCGDARGVTEQAATHAPLRRVPDAGLARRGFDRDGRASRPLPPGRGRDRYACPGRARGAPAMSISRC